MKINLLFVIFFFFVSCNTSDESSLTTEHMTLLDGCSLMYRGTDSDGYRLYALFVAKKTSSDWLFLNAWYKNTIDYKLIVKDSIVVDSMQILDILSIVDSLKIREIHPIGNNCMEVYIKDNSHPVVFSLD